VSDHLTPIRSDRGFVHLPEIHGTNGESVWVYESSAASGPNIWLKVTSPADRNRPDGPVVDAVAHLSIDEARKVAEQIIMVCDNHYQHYLETA